MTAIPSPSPGCPRAGWLLAWVLAAGVAAADDPGQPALAGEAFQVWTENDLIVRTDRHYTHGTRLGYLAAEKPFLAEDGNALDALARFVPKLGMIPVGRRGWIGLTQSIYTPRDTDATALVPDDRPYAGWLYTTWSLHVRGHTSAETPVLDQWSVNAGVVGPAALGEQSQNGVHRLRDIDEALGWDNQLSNEPAVDARYVRSWRFSVATGPDFSAEFLPHAGLQLGSAWTYATVGAQWRLGWNIPDDFGWRTIDDPVIPSGGRAAGTRPRGFYASLGIEGRVVGHNVLLDGNLFSDSHSVSKHPLWADVTLGFVYSGRRFDVAYIHTVRSKEFVGQDKVDSFGSVSVAWKW